MAIRSAAALLLAALLTACGTADPLPRPPAAPGTMIGVDFPSTGEAPLPLDTAVGQDQTNLVRALLEGGADPNARWSSHGDRFPLQMAIEGGSYGYLMRHRSEIVRLLLRHGADPNARWCPSESRARDLERFDIHGCIAESGVTPLIAAAVRDQADVTFLLLDAGADPKLEDSNGGNALDYARSEVVFLLLQARMFPVASSRDAAALDYLKRRGDASTSKAPWDETPLARATAGVYGTLVNPAPVAPQTDLPATATIAATRVQLILGLGADPNERATWGGADWTPLTIGIHYGDPAVVEELLANGADPNLRSCVSVDSAAEHRRRAQQCTANDGTTPLMWATSFGRPDMVSLLLKHGADPSLRDWQGSTAADYEAKRPNPNPEPRTSKNEPEPRTEP